MAWSQHAQGPALPLGILSFRMTVRRFKAEHALPGHWHLLRGSPEQTEALAVFLRLKLMNLGDHVIHEARVVVLDGAGRLVGQMHG